MKTFLIIAIFISSLTSFVACKSKDTVAIVTTETNMPADEHEDANTTTLSNEQIKTIGIVLGSIEQKQLSASLKANGLLRVPNQNKASVNSIYSGVIKSLFVQPGDFVRKGQAIATVANPEFIQAQSQYLATNAKIAMAELEVTRQKELNAGNAGALKNLQAAETELRTLRTVRSALQQQIQLMGINPARLSNGKLVSVLTITSPISGVVTNVIAKMGEYVDVSTAIAEIVDNSQLHLDLFVYEKDLSKLKNNQLIHFTLTNNPGKEYDAEIHSLGSSFEGSSKAVSVHARVQGDKTGLIDGMNITAVISLNNAIVPAVPNEAIVTIAGQDFIFMVTANQAPHKNLTAKNGAEINAAEANSEEGGLTFEKIPVAKGTTDVGYTEITLLKEIPKDAKIVTKGAFFVLAKLTNTGEHEH